MSHDKALAARRRFLKRIDGMIAEFEQCIRDTQSYNENHLPAGEPPIDFEAFRVALHLAKRAHELMTNYEKVPDELMARLMQTIRE